MSTPAGLLLGLVTLLQLWGAHGYDPETCGKQPLAPHHNGSLRIVGGIDVLPGAWPWLVSIQIPTSKGPRHSCGGSLLAPRWILTAAHCFRTKRSSLSHWRIVLGATDLSKLPLSTQLRSVGKVVLHQDYNPRTEANDIALMQLDRPVVFTNFVQPACLPHITMDASLFSSCYISGWGTTMQNSVMTSDVLQEARVNILDSAKCNSSQWYNGAMSPHTLCAGYEEGGIDSCQGDSGGPLMCKTSPASLYYVIGITSWGKGCAQANSPGVYTSTRHFLDWILGVVVGYEEENDKATEVPPATQPEKPASSSAWLDGITLLPMATPTAGTAAPKPTPEEDIISVFTRTPSVVSYVPSHSATNWKRKRSGARWLKTSYNTPFITPAVTAPYSPTELSPTLPDSLSTPPGIVLTLEPPYIPTEPSPTFPEPPATPPGIVLTLEPPYIPTGPSPTLPEPPSTPSETVVTLEPPYIPKEPSPILLEPPSTPSETVVTLGTPYIPEEPYPTLLDSPRSPSEPDITLEAPYIPEEMPPMNWEFPSTTARKHAQPKTPLKFPRTQEPTISLDPPFIPPESPPPPIEPPYIPPETLITIEAPYLPQETSPTPLTPPYIPEETFPPSLEPPYVPPQTRVTLEPPYIPQDVPKTTLEPPFVPPDPTEISSRSGLTVESTFAPLQEAPTEDLLYTPLEDRDTPLIPPYIPPDERISPESQDGPPDDRISPKLQDGPPDDRISPELQDGPPDERISPEPQDGPPDERISPEPQGGPPDEPYTLEPPYIPTMPQYTTPEPLYDSAGDSRQSEYPEEFLDTYDESLPDGPGFSH